MVFNMQQSTFKFWVKKPRPIRDKEQEDIIFGKAIINLIL